MLARADDLARLTVIDERGAPVVLGSLWRERTAVLAFMRHFGCVHCREHVAHLRDAVADIHRAGAELHVIGNGAANFIAGFRDETGLVGPIYTDPSLAVYRAAQLERGMRSVVNVRSALAGVGALRRGFRLGKTQGDQWQQGGVLVISRDGRVVWHHVSQYPGDNAEPSEITAALR